MEIFDILISIPLLWGAYKGFKNGIIVEVACFAALFLGVYCAFKFSDWGASLLIENFNIGKTYLPVLSFALIFIGVVILVHLVAKLVEKLVKEVSLGFVNIIAGVLFGIFKFAAIESIIIKILDKVNSTLNFIDPMLIADSIFYRPLLQLSNFLFQWANF